MKLHCDLDITQKSAWLMMHKIRKTLDDEGHSPFQSVVEPNSIFVSVKESVGETAVIRVNELNTTPQIHEYFRENFSVNATLYSDSVSTYEGLKDKHESVNQIAGQYVRQQTFTNGIESF